MTKKDTFTRKVKEARLLRKISGTKARFWVWWLGVRKYFYPRIALCAPAGAGLRAGNEKNVKARKNALSPVTLLDFPLYTYYCSYVKGWGSLYIRVLENENKDYKDNKDNKWFYI